MKLSINKLFLILPFVLAGEAMAQQVRSFSSKEAVKYALENSPTIKNAVIETDIAKAKVMETTSAGYPQISGSASLLHYPEVQRFVLENTVNTPFYIKELTQDAPIAFALQLANSFNGTISASQLIFNGSSR